MEVAFGVLHETFALYFARSTGDGVCLDSGLKVFEGMSSDIAFEGVVFVGCAFGATACFPAFCHVKSSSWVKDII